MKKISFIFCIALSSFAFAQEDLDDMFDDGDKDSRFHVGSHLLTMAGGTFNAYMDIRVIESLGLQVGAGIIPLNGVTDLMNWRPNGGQLPVRDTAVSFGTYFNLAAKIYQSAFSQTDFDVYYYADFERWKYGIQENYNVTKLKGNFGIGYNLGLVGRLNLDIQVGVYLGLDKLSTNDGYTPDSNGEAVRWDTMYEPNSSNKQFMNGFDVGVGLNFAL